MEPGKPIPSSKNRWRPTPAAVTGVVLVGLVTYGLLHDSGPDTRQLQAVRDQVDACWNESRQSPGTADEQRQKTAECQRLESSFRKQFGSTP